MGNLTPFAITGAMNPQDSTQTAIETAVKLGRLQALENQLTQHQPAILTSLDRSEVKEFIKSYDRYAAFQSRAGLEPHRRRQFIDSVIYDALPTIGQQFRGWDMHQKSEEEVVRVLNCWVRPPDSKVLFDEIKAAAMGQDDYSPAGIHAYNIRIQGIISALDLDWKHRFQVSDRMIIEKITQGLPRALREKASTWDGASTSVDTLFSSALTLTQEIGQANSLLASLGLLAGKQEMPANSKWQGKGDKRPLSEPSASKQPRNVKCFNCSGQHPLNECKAARDEARIKMNREQFMQAKEIAAANPSKKAKFTKPSGTPPGKHVVCKLTQRVHSTLANDDCIARTQGHIAVYEDVDFKSPHAISICHDTCSSDTIVPLSICRQVGAKLGEPGRMTIEDWKGDISSVLFYPVTLRIRVNNQNVSIKPLNLLVDCKAVDSKSTELILSHSVIKKANILNYLSIDQNTIPFSLGAEWAPEEQAEDNIGSFEVPVGGDQYDPSTEYVVNPEFPKLEKLKELLRRHRRVFTPKDTPMDVPPEKEFHIDLIEGAVFRKQYPRHVSPAVNDEIEREVQRWLKEGIIRRSLAPTAAPVVAVRKPDGSIRVCIDYRDLNKWTQRVHSPLPRTDDCLRKMQGKKYYGKMDLRWGFHQLAVCEDHRYLTAFITKSGTYEFNRVPFGLMNASVIYQSTVKGAVSDSPNDTVQCDNNTEVFIDDIGLGGSDEEEFLAVLDQVLTRLENAGIVVKASKCTFGFPEIEFLGHIANADGVRLKRERVQAVLDMPEPKNQAAVRRFLGVANGFRDFLPNYSTVVAPLTKLTGRNSEWEWHTPQSEAYAQLRQLVADHAMRYHIDYRYPITVRPDSSKIGIGAVLLQNVDGVERPIHFYSEKYSDAATRWSTIEQEAYAIFAAIIKMESYLLGHHFVVETDHRNLVYMAEATAPKVVRWRLRLQEFDFEIRHIPGTRNEIADTLSRCYRVIKRQREMSPKERFDSVHNSIRGHFGVDRTIEALRADGLLWDSAVKDVSSMIAKCPTCQKRNTEQGKMAPALASTSTFELFERVAIDTMGPLPEDEFGNKYVIVIIDMFSRVLELYPEKNCTAEAAARSLFQWVCRYGNPREVQSDNGPQFVSQTVEQLLQLLQISKRYTVPYRPQANGIVERSNKEILKHLRSILFDKRSSEKWSQSLPLVQRIINTAHHSALGTYPLRILFGDAISATTGLLTDWEDLTRIGQNEAYSAYVEALNDQLRAVVLASRDTLKDVVEHRLQKSPETPTSFKVGDYVLVKYPTGPPDKLKLYWKGPYQVTSIQGQNYSIKDLLSEKTIERFVDQLKLFQQEDDAQPSDIGELAAIDNDVYIVEKIIGHKGNFKKANTLHFKVQWLGYPLANDESDWIPWSEARKLVMIKDYLKDHPKLRYLMNRVRPSKIDE